MCPREPQWSLEPSYEAELRNTCHCGHLLGSHIESERSTLVGYDWQLIDLRCTALGCECSGLTTRKS